MHKICYDKFAICSLPQIRNHMKKAFIFFIFFLFQMEFNLLIVWKTIVGNTFLSANDIFKATSLIYFSFSEGMEKSP